MEATTIQMTMIHLKRTLGHLLSAPDSQTEATKILVLHVACNRFQVTPQFTLREAWLECHPKKNIAHDILGAPDQIFQGTVIIKVERYEEHIPIYSLAMSKSGAEKEECLLQEDMFVLLPMTIKSPHLIFKDGVKQ